MTDFWAHLGCQYTHHKACSLRVASNNAQDGQFVKTSQSYPCVDGVDSVLTLPQTHTLYGLLSSSKGSFSDFMLVWGRVFLDSGPTAEVA